MPAQFRFRGNIAPSAEVKRPVAAVRNEANGSSAGSSGTIDIFDVIDSFGGWWGVSAAEVDAAMRSLGDVETVYVRLNSPGGEATEGVAIANLLRAHKADVRVTVYGLAASATSIIAIAGDRVSMAPGSLMMIHEASAFAYGDADTVRKAAAMLDTINESLAGLYALKAGGDSAEWRTAMNAVTWYAAADAVKAKLADAVGIDPQLPAGLPPVEDDAEDDPDIEIEIDIELSPAARAAARRFDLSMLPNAPAALAPQAPAASADGSTQTHERSAAVAFTDEQLTNLRQDLGLPADADEATILAKVSEQKSLLEQATAPDADKQDSEPDAAAVEAALAKSGKVAVSQAYLDTLKEGSEAGKAALARQQREDRDAAIAKAQSEGKIGRSEETVKSWQAAWDRDPASTAKEIEALGVRFPVGGLQGHQGDDGTPGGNAAFTDDEAAELGNLVGVSKEALQA